MNAAFCANPTCDKSIDLAAPHVTISRSVEVEVEGAVTVAEAEVLHRHHLACFEQQIARTPQRARARAGMAVLTGRLSQALPTRTDGPKEHTR